MTGIRQPYAPPVNLYPDSATLRLETALFGRGQVTKVVTGGVASWQLPCGLDVGLAGVPRQSGESLLCYFRRLSTTPIPGTEGPPGPQGPPGNQGHVGWTFTTASFAAPSGTSVFFITPESPDIGFFEPVNVVFIDGLGWVTVLQRFGNSVQMAVRELIVNPLAVIPAGARIVHTGRVGPPNDPNTPVTLAPVFLPVPGVYSGTQSIEITSQTPAATIYFTTDGTEPTVNSTVYSGPISCPPPGFVLRAFASAIGHLNSSVTSGTYTVSQPVTEPVSFSPNDGSFIDSVDVTLATATPGPYEIRYSLDPGIPPGPGTNLYTGPITLTDTRLIRATVVKAGYTSAAANEKTYTKLEPIAIKNFIIDTPPDDTFWISKYSVSDMTINVGGFTNLFVKVNGWPARLGFVYDDALLGGAEVQFGVPGNHGEDTGTFNYPLSGSDTEVILARATPVGDYSPYFQMSGDTHAEITLTFYAW